MYDVKQDLLISGIVLLRQHISSSSDGPANKTTQLFDVRTGMKGLILQVFSLKVRLVDSSHEVGSIPAIFDPARRPDLLKALRHGFFQKSFWQRIVFGTQSCF